jgi:hypothetical protein
VKSEWKCDPEVHKVALRGWEVVRYVVYARILYGVIRRKRAAVDVIKIFSAQLAEWARLRRSMARLRNNFKTLQHGCRMFLLNKRKRCELMSKEWQRVEDLHLSTHFKTLAEKTIQEEKARSVDSKAGKSKGGSVRHQREVQNQRADKKGRMIEQMMLDHVEWKIYRIHSAERTAIIRKYYMVKFRKRIENKIDILAVAKELLRNHHDFVDFLQAFGADESQAEDLKSMVPTATNLFKHRTNEFWELTEAIVLDLIAFAAQHMPPEETHWKDHPANREISGMANTMYRVVKGGHEANFLRMTGEHTQLEQLEKKKNDPKKPRGIVPGHTASSEPQERKADGPPDFDDLWTDFTPRLLEGTQRPLTHMSDRPSSRPGLGDQDQAAWRLENPGYEVAGPKTMK